MTKQLIPKRRFKTFNKIWVEKKFDEMIIRLSALSKVADLPNVEYEDIISGTGRLNKDLSKKKVQKSGILFSKGDVLFGKLRPYLKNWLLADFEGIAIGDFWVFRPLEIDSDFLYYLIQTDSYQKVANLSIGTKMPRSDWSTVSNTFFRIPDKSEQQKIGEFFKVLDARLANQERKIEKIKAIKQAYLTEIFPQEGEDTPKRRFKEFQGKWEKYQLSEVAEVISGGTPSTINSNYWDGQIDWYTPTEIERNIYMTGSQRKITELGLKNSSAKLLPPFRTILFTSRAGIGNMAILAKEGSTNQGFQSFVLKGNMDTYFLYSMGYQIKEYALRNASGSTFLEVSRPTLERTPLHIPQFAEQQKIGEFFKTLDEKIEAEEKKLEKLKKMKEAFLEEMFV